jgi:hypothetical protein
VTFHDPLTFPFHLVYGQTPVEMTQDPRLDYNFPTSKHRTVNKMPQFTKGPSPIHKLGHFGLCVTNTEGVRVLPDISISSRANLYDDNRTDITTCL